MKQYTQINIGLFHIIIFLECYFCRSLFPGQKR